MAQTRKPIAITQSLYSSELILVFPKVAKNIVTWPIRWKTT